MQIEVNETNIDKFDLVRLTGNSREDMLSRAAEAEEQGYILNCQIPDDILHTNVFEAVESTPVNQEEVGVGPCTYRRYDNVSGHPWICQVHGVESKHRIEAGSHRPCLQVDP